MLLNTLTFSFQTFEVYVNNKDKLSKQLCFIDNLFYQHLPKHSKMTIPNILLGNYPQNCTFLHRILCSVCLRASASARARVRTRICVCVCVCL